ncbi:MAG: hypothetical protein ASARMPRED_004951 [Alectoria sarmentosa]|nr:MAG: hypothetical protein ASARMPRED_004951 [Alectoria sarmentosa]
MVPSEQSMEQALVEFDVNKSPSMSTILWLKTFLIKMLPLELVELVLDHAEYWPHTTTIKPRLGLLRTPVKWRGTCSDILSPSWPSPESEAMQEVLGFTLYSPPIASEINLTRAATLKKGLRRLVRRDPEICLPPRGQHPARMIVLEAISQRYDVQIGKFCDVGIIREDDQLLEQGAPAAESQRRNSSALSAFRSNTKPSKPEKTYHLVAQRECWFSPGAKAEGKYVIKWRYDQDLEDGIKKPNDESILPSTNFIRKLKVGDSIELWAPVVRAYRPSTTRPLYLALKSASRINNAVSLNSLGVYVNTIQLIYRAVQNGWGNPSSLTSGHAYGVNVFTSKRLSNGRLGAQRHIVDPDDRSSIITNSYDGETLASEDVVTSVLDGVTSSALLDNQHPCNAFYTASLTSRLDFGVVTPGFKTAPLSYFYMRKMYRLLALEMVGRDKYAEVEVGLKYGGEKIEEGFARLALVLDNGMSGMATTKQAYLTAVNELKAHGIPAFLKFPNLHVRVISIASKAPHHAPSLPSQRTSGKPGETSEISERAFVPPPPFPLALNYPSNPTRPLSPN